MLLLVTVRTMGLVVNCLKRIAGLVRQTADHSSVELYKSVQQMKRLAFNLVAKRDKLKLRLNFSLSVRY